MAKASVDFQRTASTTLSVGNVTAPASSMRRVAINYLEVGSEDTAGDGAFSLFLQRCTTTGTRTSVTPQTFDPADAALVATAGENHTVDATYTANAIMLNKAFNQRANCQWYAQPDGPLLIPATANNGIGVITPVATSLVKVSATLHITEF